MAVTRSQIDIQQDVAQALANDVRVDAANVQATVVAGVVYLRGTVPSYFEKRIAAEDANRIRGVADVVNELRVTPAAARRDQEITGDIRAALARDVRVDETRIGVATAGGIVRLSGTVDSYADRYYADSDAWTVPGVVDVVDDIAVEPAPTRTDQQVADDVRAALIADPRVDFSQIAVDARDGIVHLRGSVPTVQERWQAEGDAWWTPGVRNVVDELAVVFPEIEPTGSRRAEPHRSSGRRPGGSASRATEARGPGAALRWAERMSRRTWVGHGPLLEDTAHVLGGIGVGLLLYPRLAGRARGLAYALVALSGLMHVYAYLTPGRPARAASTTGTGRG